MQQDKNIITAWRAIYLDEIEQLDINNFGCHWTFDEFYCNSVEFIYNNISNKKRLGKIQFLFKASINKNLIDIKRTRESNKEFPSESECVLKQDIELLNVELIFPLNKIIKCVNTGNRIEQKYS